jgi:hypothetical protein
MKVYVANKLVRWEDIRIPTLKEDGEVGFIQPMPDSITIGFLPVFAEQEQARIRFPDESVTIMEGEYAEPEESTPADEPAGPIGDESTEDTSSEA